MPNNGIFDYNRYISGCISGIVEVITTHPLDYIKTKKQEFIQNKQGFLKHNNFYHHLLRTDGFNLYKGVVPRVCGIAPMRLVFWGVQDSANNYFTQYPKLSKLKKGLIVGTLGGCCQTIIDNPIEVLKINRMTGNKIDTSFSSLSKIIFRYGFKETLLRNIGFAICISTLCFQNKSENNLYNFSISACAGVLGSVLTQPIDYIKTKKQQLQNTKILNKQYPSQSLMSILRNIDNPRQLYVGGFNRALLSFFSMGIGYVTYSNLYSMLSSS